MKTGVFKPILPSEPINHLEDVPHANHLEIAGTDLTRWLAHHLRPERKFFSYQGLTETQEVPVFCPTGHSLWVHQATIWLLPGAWTWHCSHCMTWEGPQKVQRMSHFPYGQILHLIQASPPTERRVPLSHASRQSIWESCSIQSACGLFYQNLDGQPCSR